MGIDAVIRWFLPREERFHVILERDTQNLVTAAKLFLEVASADSLATRRVKAVELKARRARGRRRSPASSSRP